jgi:hypothetical protein
VEVTTDEVVSKPFIAITFDKPYLKAVLHGLDGNQFYSNSMMLTGGNILRYSFDGPPFDQKLKVEFTVYAAEPIHVKTFGGLDFHVQLPLPTKAAEDRSTGSILRAAIKLYLRRHPRITKTPETQVSR